MHDPPSRKGKERKRRRVCFAPLKTFEALTLLAFSFIYIITGGTNVTNNLIYNQASTVQYTRTSACPRALLVMLCIMQSVVANDMNWRLVVIDERKLLCVRSAVKAGTTVPW
jgi:hypothetical protein